MASELTPELREALAGSPEFPLEFVDSQSNRHYVFMPAEMYESLAAARDGSELDQAAKDADLRDWALRSGYFEPLMGGAYDDAFRAG